MSAEQFPIPEFENYGLVGVIGVPTEQYLDESIRAHNWKEVFRHFVLPPQVRSQAEFRRDENTIIHLALTAECGMFGDMINHFRHRFGVFDGLNASGFYIKRPQDAASRIGEITQSMWISYEDRSDRFGGPPDRVRFAARLGDLAIV